MMRPITVRAGREEHTLSVMSVVLGLISYITQVEAGLLSK